MYTNEDYQLYQYLEYLWTEQLTRKARWLGVAVPIPNHYKLMRDRDDGTWRITDEGDEVLNESARQEFRQPIWSREIEIASIVFGISSIVQAVYAALAYPPMGHHQTESCPCCVLSQCRMEAIP